jgi:hypothetical protein
VFHPSKPGTVYLGANDLWASYDNGESWQSLTAAIQTWDRIMNGLDLRSGVTQLLLDPRDPSRIYVGARLGEVPFVARFATEGALPGRVRVPSAASTGLSRSDFASYLGDGIAKAVASTPTGGIVIALEVRPALEASRIAGVAAVVIEDYAMGRPR